MVDIDKDIPFLNGLEFYEFLHIFCVLKYRSNFNSYGNNTLQKYKTSWKYVNSYGIFFIP